MSGRNPLLYYTTLALIAMQGRDTEAKRRRKRYDEPGYSSFFVTLGLRSDGMGYQDDCITILLAIKQITDYTSQ